MLPSSEEVSVLVGEVILLRYWVFCFLVFCWFHFIFSVVFRGQQKQKGSYIIKKEKAFTTTNDF